MIIKFQESIDKPKVNIGDVLVTRANHRVMLVENKTKEKVLAINLDNNTLSREYDSVEDFLENYSNNYTIYRADNIELTVKGSGEEWQFLAE